MRITLNLASRPYVELRPVFARLRLIGGILCLLALVLWLSLRTLERKAAVADANVSHWTNLTDGLQREWQQDRDMMQQPQNAATLERSDYLNNLFTSKAFSWTAALMDLENVLPAGVQVISLAPQMTKDGRVLVHLHVSGERDKAVDLVKNLERSQHFLHPRLVGETAEQPESSGRPGFVPQPSIATDVNFDILAEYNPQRMEDMPSIDKKEKGESQTPEGNSGNATRHRSKRGAQ
ncbi:MAG TPA: fimbrial assembly protein [Acidobacteriaceae bacterium]|jgi:type IV pilus assembly protein PilN|nr:fimbrial assembly protein [Acidobacteriaceae bacterium]